jgi:phage portal protein BeeE
MAKAAWRKIMASKQHHGNGVANIIENGGENVNEIMAKYEMKYRNNGEAK